MLVDMGMTALVMGAPVTWGAVLGAPIEIDARLSVGTSDALIDAYDASLLIINDPFR